jgi:ammonium transporter, Amt family
MEQRQVLLVLLGVCVLTARLGLGFYLAGISQAKNAAAAVTRTLADLFVGVLAFWLLGIAILNGRWWPGGLSTGQDFFFATTILIATGIALGATLERSRLVGPLVLSVVLAGGIVPLAGRWAWWGWLHRMGFVDVGGASVLHLCGGLAAAAGAIVLGPRSGKYNVDGSVSGIPAHNVPLVAAGALTLTIGMLAQIVGCAAIQDTSPMAAAGDVLVAAAAGGLAGLLLSAARYGSVDLTFVVVAMLGGGVSMSAGAGRVHALNPIFIGGAGGVLSPFVMIWLDAVRRLDDPSCFVAIHGAGGLWSLLAAGLFLPEAAISQRLHQLAVQAAGAAAIGGVALASSAIVFVILRSTVGLRMAEADELDGADLAEHDINAYPDFQQTMIKSYHLRER